MRRGARRAGRRTARRTARRTTRRTVHRTRRRFRRRRLLVGGFTLLLVGGAAYGAVKLSQKDTQRVEQYTGKNAEDLTEEELVAAMQSLGIQSIDLTDQDKAAIDAEAIEEDSGAAQIQYTGSSQPASEESYLNELEKLADLRDRGIITEEEFEAKKRQLLGL
jgi:hypothetical protein